MKGETIYNPEENKLFIRLTAISTLSVMNLLNQKSNTHRLSLINQSQQQKMGWMRKKHLTKLDIPIQYPFQVRFWRVIHPLDKKTFSLQMWSQ